MLDRKGILVFKRDTDALVASLRGALTLHKALKGAQLSLYSPSYPPPPPPPTMQTSHLPHIACHSKNSVLILFTAPISEAKFTSLMQVAFFSSLLIIFAKHSPEYPKIIVLVTDVGSWNLVSS